MKIQPTLISKILSYFSTRRACPSMSVQDFVKKTRLDHRQVLGCEHDTQPSNCWDKFSSLNDIFTRRRTQLPPSSSTPTAYRQYIHRSFYIATGVTLHSSTKTNTFISSPADCFAVGMCESTLRVWIKGKHFSPSELFKATLPSSYYLLVCRLAPQHYHRFHSPVTGKVTRIWQVGVKHYSVQPSIVNSRVNVFNENVRIVLDIKTRLGTIHMAIIGATCVSSIVFTNKSILSSLSDLKRGGSQALTYTEPIIFKKPPVIHMNDELGMFQYGGSSIALLIPSTTNRTRIFEHVLNNTNRHVPCETQLTVGDILGS